MINKLLHRITLRLLRRMLDHHSGVVVVREGKDIMVVGCDIERAECNLGTGYMSGWCDVNKPGTNIKAVFLGVGSSMDCPSPVGTSISGELKARF